MRSFNLCLKDARGPEAFHCFPGFAFSTAPLPLSCYAVLTATIGRLQLEEFSTPARLAQRINGTYKRQNAVGILPPLKLRSKPVFHGASLEPVDNQHPVRRRWPTLRDRRSLRASQCGFSRASLPGVTPRPQYRANTSLVAHPGGAPPERRHATKTHPFNALETLNMRHRASAQETDAKASRSTHRV